MRPTFILPHCGPCLVETALKFLKEGTTDERAVFDGMEKVFAILARGFTKDAYTFNLGNEIARAVAEHLNNPDIFAAVKQASNALCSAMVPALLDEYNTLDDDRAKLDLALVAGIAGNVIDVGTAGHDFTLDARALQDIIGSIRAQGFAIDDREALRAALRDPGVHRVMVMLDNAGEIALDKLLLVHLKEQGKHVACMVKGQPVANDATRDDLEQVGGFGELCNEIVETSIASLGYTIPENEQDVIDVVNSMDIIIAKGQANLETVSTFIDEIRAKHVFLVSRIKCPTVAAFQGTRVGDNIVRQLK